MRNWLGPSRQKLLLAIGGLGDDSLAGSDGGDRILGLEGADTLMGGLSGDRLLGGPGRDRLYGGEGDDTIKGGGDQDGLWGGAGSDLLVGGRGSDVAIYDDAPAAVQIDLARRSAQDTGGSGVDTLRGIEEAFGSGFNDTIAGARGWNLLNGGPGDDILYGRNGNDYLWSYEGLDTMVGGAGDDYVFSSAAEGTVIHAGPGADGTIDLVTYYTLFAGSGDDWIRTISDTRNEIHAGSGNDHILSAWGNVWGGAGDDEVSEGWGTFLGGQGDDRIRAMGHLSGGQGDDLIEALATDDTLRCGSGHDTMTGGYGADRFVIDLKAIMNSGERSSLLIEDLSAEDVVDLGGFGLAAVPHLSGDPRQVRAYYLPEQDQTVFSIDWDGDSQADYKVRAWGDHTDDGTLLL